MYHIREASPIDAALISRMIASSWRSAYQGLIDPVYLSRLPEEAWLPSMRTWLSSGRMYGYIAELNGEPAGCIILGRSRDESHAEWGEIVALYMLPAHTGNGGGSALLQTALDSLRQDGYRKVFLWAINSSQRTLRFYRRHGFSVTDDLVEYKLGSRPITDVRLIREATDV